MNINRSSGGTSLILAISLAFFLLTSCTTTVQSTTTSGAARAVAIVDGSNLKLNVIVEGSDGNSISGPVVTITDPGGAISLPAFDTQKAAFVLSAPALAGNYQIEVSSQTLSEISPRNLTVPVTVLSPAPNVTLVRDDTGSSAQEFKKLKAASAIQIDWNPSPNSQTYLVEVRQNGKSVFSKILAETSIILPVGTLEGSDLGTSASILITASSTRGDPRFKTARYFSSSGAVGSTFSFQVIP
jgi:hypothetical protein